MFEIEKKLIEELKQKGFNYPDINYLFHKKILLPKSAVRVILNWLPLMYEENVGAGNGLVRSLISADEPFDPSLLINLFQKSVYNTSIKFGLAYTLAMAKTYDIAEWMQETLVNHTQPFESVGLLFGLPAKGNFNNVAHLVSFLKTIFDKYSFFEQYFKLLKKYASKDDIPFLEERAKNADKKLSMEISKTIEAILKRKNEPKLPKVDNGIREIIKPLSVFSISKVKKNDVQLGN